MDPISQFTIGACAALAVSSRVLSTSAQPTLSAPLEQRSRRRWIIALGGLAGAAPDLDVLIRSSQDPLLSLEFHRHFTHALAFIPLGAGLLALLLWTLFRSPLKRLGFRLTHVLIFSCVGWATHAPLDACTSYGTQLLWPFSSTRVAWNLVGVIDPLPTLAWLLAILVALISLRPGVERWAKVSLVLSLIYLVLTGVQRERAETLQAELVDRRHGHAIVNKIPSTPKLRASVKPTLLQTILWKSVYEFNGRIYTDALWMGAKPKVYAGQCIEKYQISAPADSVLESDLRRFAWFSDDWLGIVAHGGETSERVSVGDVRYSMLPHQIEPLWGIEFDIRQPDRHVQTWASRRRDEATLNEYFKMIRGETMLADATIARSVAEFSETSIHSVCLQ